MRQLPGEEKENDFPGICTAAAAVAAGWADDGVKISFELLRELW